MTATLDGVTKRKPIEQSAEQQAAIELVRMAREQGLSLAGPDGLLKQLTKDGHRDGVERGDDRAYGL
jgi:putative transposase